MSEPTETKKISLQKDDCMYNIYLVKLLNFTSNHKNI